jgi:hypothetical protein
MDWLLYLIAGVVFIGGCVIAVNRIMNGWFYIEKIEEVVEDTLADLKEAADEVADKIEEEVKEALDNLPTADELKKLTKAKIEELGKQLGVDLDKRKTKAIMIKDLEDHVGK